MSEQEIKDFLYDEVLVDCKDEIEQNMSWFYFVQDEMEFPYEAEIVLKKVIGGKETKKVTAIALANDDSNFDRAFGLKVEVRLGKHIIEMSLAKLEKANASEKTLQIIDAWKYWIRH